MMNRSPAGALWSQVECPNISDTSALISGPRQLLMLSIEQLNAPALAIRSLKQLREFLCSSFDQFSAAG